MWGKSASGCRSNRQKTNKNPKRRQSQNFASFFDNEVNYLYYGENAVGEVYLKDGQLPEAFQDVIVQNGTCYSIKLTLNGRDRGDLAWNIPAALRENGCIPAEDE